MITIHYDKKVNCSEFPNNSDLISRQAAIDELHGKDPSQIWDTADIEVWLNALPSAQPQKRTEERTETHARDLISRQAAIDALETIGYDFSDSGLSEIELEEICEAVGDVRQDMIDRIKRLPPAQPEQ